jgi:phenylalanyl-tRNA synthetase beta chain
VAATLILDLDGTLVDTVPDLRAALNRLMAARGLDEAIVWSFIGEAQARAFGGHAFRLENPLSAELAVMRPSLLPGMLAAAARNAARARSSIRLFQTGRRYRADGERPTLALLLAGDAAPRDWRTGHARAFDVFDMKAEIMAALTLAGVPADRVQTRQPAAAHYHPGRSAQLVLGKAVLAEFGALHPEVARAFDCELPVVAGEIFLDALPPVRSRRSRGAFAPSALQPLERDYAFLVAADRPAEVLLRAVAGADRALIAEVSLFDRFEGAGVPDGQVSLGVAVTIQPRQRTLTEADLDALSARIVAAAAKVGAVIRS